MTQDYSVPLCTFDKVRIVKALLDAAVADGACEQWFADLFLGESVSVWSMDPKTRTLEFTCKSAWGNLRPITFTQSPNGERCSFEAKADGETSRGEFSARSCLGLTHKDIFAFCFQDVRVHTVVGEDRDDADAY